MSKMSLSVTSTAFEHNGRIQMQFAGDGRDASPPLAWSGVPESTRELALICDDPDAPTPQPWVHWLYYCSVQPPSAISAVPVT